jgi:Hypoxia induced protein conserved region
MEVVLIIALLGAMGMVVFALIRGLGAFAKMDLDDVDEQGIPRALAKQNSMMFARIKWQAVAIAVVMVLLAVGSAAGK